MLPPDILTVEDIDGSRGMTINELPFNSAICEPVAHARMTSGLRRLRGWAAASGRDVSRVDVSADGGPTWRQAHLDSNQSPSGWVLWGADLTLDVGEHELAVRAWDSAGQTQLALPDDTWNVKGYLSAAWHRIPVSVS